MQHEAATDTARRGLGALALAAVMAVGVGAPAIATARSVHHRHTTVEPTSSASPSDSGCDDDGTWADYWTGAETRTGVPREVQIGMTAIGYATAGVAPPELCTGNR